MNESNLSKTKKIVILALAFLGIPLAMAATDRVLEGKYLRSIPGGGLVTVPNVTDTMSTIAGTETLSNKTIIGANGNTVWATRLMSTSATCSSGQFVSGITVNGVTTCSTPTGGGDASGPASSSDNGLPLFSGTSGKLFKAAAGTGAVSVSAGVVTQGTLTVPNGGTGVATIPSGALVVGQGASAVSQLVVPASGYFAQSNGTNWTTAQTLGGANGGTGVNSITTNSIVIGQGTSAVSQLLVPATGHVIRSNGTSWSPVYETVSNLGRPNYFIGGLNGDDNFSATSASYADPAIGSGNTALVTTAASGITVTKMATNGAGFTWTPPSVTAVYWFAMTFTIDISAAVASKAVVTDSTQYLGNAFAIESTGTLRVPFTISGLYIPGTVSPTTLKVQVASASGAVTITGGSGRITNEKQISFSLIQLAQ